LFDELQFLDDDAARVGIGAHALMSDRDVDRFSPNRRASGQQQCNRNEGSRHGYGDHRKPPWNGVKVKTAKVRIFMARLTANFGDSWRPSTSPSCSHLQTPLVAPQTQTADKRRLVAKNV